LCLGKALTGGYMSLAATLCNNRVAEGIAADGQGVLMHGPTFMANPLACRVACESLKLLQESNWQQQVSAIEQQLQEELTPLNEEKIVSEVRVKGAIGVVELNVGIDQHMDWLPDFIVEQGVWIRPFRNLIYIMPPYIISEDDLATLTQAMAAMVKEITSHVS
jgi:adenosylmethionine-8-amino-7-oxononanoate aminotransferase